MCSDNDTFVQTLKNIKMKKVIIIGATSGIGKGLAERFLREGNTVGITGRREDKLQEICSQNKNFIVFPMLPKIPIQSDN